MSTIDLRSDTVTLPTDEMRRAMAAADVGDDVWGEDPTVNALEERAAELLGKEAGLFVSSGTMGNLVSLMAHVPRGGEIIAGAQSHIVRDEAAGHAVVVGASVLQLVDRPDGSLDPAAVAGAFRDPSDPHEPITSLVAIENAHSHSGNQPIDVATTAAIAAVAHERGVPLHVDGARFFNTVVALGVRPAELARPADLRHVLPVEGPGLPGRLGRRRDAAVRRACPAGSQAPRRRDAPVLACSRRPDWSRCATAMPG
jgi:threonine aldolase